jgi:glycosyltransferase involved in cell wall biosynthesis
VTRLLYILPGLAPPDSDPSRDKFYYLSELCEGEVLLPVWWRATDEVSPYLKVDFPIYRVRRFNYHLLLFHKPPQFLRKILAFFWYLRSGVKLHRENKIDVIITYGTNMPAVAGRLLKWLTGAKLIVEIPGVPENAFRYDVPSSGKRTVIKRFIADRFLSYVGRRSDCFKLLYPSQLQKYPILRRKTAAVFHDFVPVRCVKLTEREESFILCVGYPWYTKGFDILIYAFRSIAKRFPEYKLKLLGFVPDRQILEKLAKGCSQIEFLDPCPYESALQVISACTVYVLASRTEAMGRVLLEAMAAARPIIASNVGGVARYVNDNQNGLLFPSENVEELASAIALLLSDKELRRRLGQKGHERVYSEFDEKTYVREFQKMLELIGAE